MDKYEQLKKEYERLEDAAAEFFVPGSEKEFEYYIESVMLRVWGANARYSSDYAKALEAVGGRALAPTQITKAMSDSMDEQEKAKIPSFFARMVDSDFSNGRFRTKRFIEGFRSLIVGAACINGDFTIGESNALSAEIKKLMTYAISKGVKVSYSAARIREKTTPLNEASYAGRTEASFAELDALFEVMNENFLKPASLYRRDATEKDSIGGPGGFGAGSPEAGGPGETPGTGEETQAGQSDQEPASTVEVQEDPRTMEELLEELDALVGLTGIKEDIRSLMNFIRITKMREERGLKVPTISYHLVFTGNPGTGKTTVARLVAGLYHRIGVLPKGQLVEADRSQLVAGFLGQTAIKTRDVINQAMGGVLFIDEAYALVHDDQDSYGKEAIETILKSMEDHRDELVVIVAGYTELMHKFIESNPGFRSRFSKFFEFPDYTGEELLQIFLTFCKKNGYHLQEEASEFLKAEFDKMYEQRDSHFGNGRTARNVFEKAINQQANRLAMEAGTDPMAPAAGEEKPDEEADAAPEKEPAAEGTEPGVTEGETGSADGGTGSVALTDQQLQELTIEDLKPAIEAENRKIQLPTDAVEI